MIVVTGACGFIGSALIHKLNSERHFGIVAVDKFHDAEKLRNVRNLKIAVKVDRDHFNSWFSENHREVEFVYHLGARTDTMEYDTNLLDALNTQYSKDVWTLCVKYHKPMVYASSAATYGNGTEGFKDDESDITSLKPLNPYGHSKQRFDAWVLQQEDKPPFWAGLKFFNVYGPQEYHKKRMASVIYHSYHQIQATKGIKLFKSYSEHYKDGAQQRDFIYVKDVVNVLFFLSGHQNSPGIYNLGTGQAETFTDLVRYIFHTCQTPENIEFIEMPDGIRQNYQYFTCAEMTKLRNIGYTVPFHSLEHGVSDYITQYLKPGKGLSL